MKTEKISVNLSITELAQIDLLVEKGLFDSRSDFMRLAARKVLDGHGTDFKQFLEPEFLKHETQNQLTFTFGIAGITKSVATRFIAQNKKMHVRVIGLLTISKNITADEARQLFASCKVYGKLIASDEVKAILQELEENIS